MRSINLSVNFASLLLGLSIGLGACFVAPEAVNGQALAEKGIYGPYWNRMKALHLHEKQIKKYRRMIQAYLVEKKVTKKSKRRRELMRMVEEAHNLLELEVSKYNRIRLEVRYLFPAKGEETERRYLPMRAQKLEQIEQELGLDSLLTDIGEHVKRKYASIESNEKQEFVEELKLTDEDKEKGMQNNVFDKKTGKARRLILEK